MAKELGEVKCDPNREAFQMRAQWKKSDNCRKQWFDKWSWLLDERKHTLEEADAIRAEMSDMLPCKPSVQDTGPSLKPVPVTTTGFVGWLANKPECKLEKYTSWISKIPVRAPDAWQSKSYLGPPDN